MSILICDIKNEVLKLMKRIVHGRVKSMFNPLLSNTIYVTYFRRPRYGYLRETIPQFMLSMKTKRH